MWDTKMPLAGFAKGKERSLATLHYPRPIDGPFFFIQICRSISFFYSAVFSFLARLYEVQGELLQSPRSSAFPSHCDKVLFSSFPKVHISTAKVTMTYILQSSDFALYLENFLIYEHHTFRIMSQYDQTFDLKMNVGHCDLYFMVPWFCLIFWRLFDIWTPYFGIMSQYDPMFDLKINVTVTYISWSSDFALYLEDCLMYEHHTSGLWVSTTQHLTSK